MFTAVFWKDTAERVVMTVAQALIAILTVDGFDLLNADWKAVVATAVLAGAIAFLKALVAGKFVTGSDTSVAVSPASLVTDDRGF